MRIAVCDDDRTIRGAMSDFIKEYFSKSKYPGPELVCYSEGNGLLGDESIPDIVFLDMELPGIGGVDIGNLLYRKNRNIIIIVITSYMDYLDDAMRFHVFRYISKPLDMARVKRNLDEALELYFGRQKNILIETKQAEHTVNIRNIIAIEASGRSVTVYTLSGAYESVHNMQYWEDTLPKSIFIRTHRNFIVNMYHVKEFTKDTITVTNNVTEVFLTKRKYTDFKKGYLMFLEKRS